MGWYQVQVIHHIVGSLAACQSLPVPSNPWERLEDDPIPPDRLVRLSHSPSLCVPGRVRLRLQIHHVLVFLVGLRLHSRHFDTIGQLRPFTFPVLLDPCEQRRHLSIDKDFREGKDENFRLLLHIVISFSVPGLSRIEAAFVGKLPYG